MRYVELEPGGPLRGRVRFWRLTGEGVGGAVEPVLPDGCVEMIVHLGEPFRRREGGREERQARVLLAGPGTRPVFLAPAGRVDVLGARFEAGAAGALCGMMEELVDRIPALDEIEGGLARGLAEELAEPRAGERWTEVLERRLAPLLGPSDPAVAGAVARLRATHGRASVAELASAAGLSTRQLERRFRARVGLGPKMLARIARFHRAWGLAARAASLAEVAARAGYFDQAHLVRDFRQFAGEAPGRFLAEEHALAEQFSPGHRGIQGSRSGA